MVSKQETTLPGDLPVFDQATELAFDAIITTVMTKIISVVPLFGVSGFNLVVKSLVKWVLSYAWNPMTNLAAFFIIDAQQAKKAADYKEAVTDLKEALKNDPYLTSEEVKKAHEEFKKRLGTLIRIGPN